MKNYYFIYLIWVLPAYFLFQAGYQTLTYIGIESTYEEGESYVAEVVDFDVKQIAAQTNGYVILKFSTSDNEVVQEQLALSVQMAQLIMSSELIPVRYLESSFNPIVMTPVHRLQLSVIKVNLTVSLIGLIVTLILAILASKFAGKRLREGEDQLVIERLDPENTD